MVRKYSLGKGRGASLASPVVTLSQRTGKLSTRETTQQPWHGAVLPACPMRLLACPFTPSLPKPAHGHRHPLFQGEWAAKEAHSETLIPGVPAPFHSWNKNSQTLTHTPPPPTHTHRHSGAHAFAREASASSGREKFKGTFFEIQTAAFMVHPQSIGIALAVGRARAGASRGSTAIRDTLLRYSCCDLYFHAKLAQSIFTSSAMPIVRIILHLE